MSQLLHQTTSRELAEWMAFFEVEDELQKEQAEDEKAKRARQSSALLQARLTQAGRFAEAKKRKHAKKNKR